MLMDYKLIYERIIFRAKTRAELSGYVERHHIIPRCMGGGDEKENIAVLTPEEHYVCHQLLVKIYPDIIGLWRAVYMMTYSTTKTKHIRRSNKMYGWLKRKNKWKKRIEINCKFCNKAMSVLSCLKRQFCSRECKYKSIEKPVIKNCKFCNKEFCLTPTTSFRQFCSPRCSSNFQIKKVAKKCLTCNKEFTGEPNVIKKRKFCSYSCSSIFKRGKPKFSPERVTTTSKPCNYCGKLMYGKPGKLKQKNCCSNSCGAKARWMK